jgi:hypothetical protein
VVTALGASGDPVGGHQRAVQAHERQCSGTGAAQDLVEVGCVGGDHVQGLVQISVGGGDADAGLDSQIPQVQAVAQPAQHENDLGVHCPGALRRPGT